MTYNLPPSPPAGPAGVPGSRVARLGFGDKVNRAQVFLELFMFQRAKVFVREESLGGPAESDACVGLIYSLSNQSRPATAVFDPTFSIPRADKDSTNIGA